MINKMKPTLWLCLLLLAAAQTNTQRRIKKVTEKKDLELDNLMAGAPMPTPAQPSQSDLQKDCDLKEPSLKRDYACLELSVLTLDAFDLKTLKTLANTMVLLKAQAAQQKHKALAQTNRLMNVQRKILKAKQVIMAQGCKWMCGHYVQMAVPFDQDEIVTAFTRDYVTAFGRYIHVYSSWRSAVVLRSGWAGIRRVMYSYFDWSVSTYYPYYYSLYWVPANGVFFSSSWWATNVYSFYQPLYTFCTYREPAQVLEPAMVKGLDDQELTGLVQQTNEVEEQKSTEDNASEEALEDQLNKGSLDATKLRGQFEAQEDALQADIQKQEQQEPFDDQEPEDKEDNEEKERQRREQEEKDKQRQEEEKRRQEEVKAQSYEDQKQKTRQQDMFNLGNDLDSMGNIPHHEEEQTQEEDTTGCDYVVESDNEIEPCENVPQDHCGTYCIKTGHGIQRVQGIKREFKGQAHQQQEQDQMGQNNQMGQMGQMGNPMMGGPQDWNSVSYRRLDKKAKQSKMDTQSLAQSNNLLLTKIVGLLSQLGGAVEQPRRLHRHHRRH